MAISHSGRHDELREEDGRIVSLESVWRADPSVAEVDDLAPRWFAWRQGGGTLAAVVGRTPVTRNGWEGAVGTAPL